MPDPMIGSYEDPPRAERVEVTLGAAAAPLVDGGEGADRRRDVSARQLGLACREASWHRGNQLFTWRRLMAQGALTAAGAEEEVVPASELRSAHQQIRGDCQESCVRGHSEAAGGELWQSRRVHWTSCFRDAIPTRFFPRTVCSMN